MKHILSITICFLLLAVLQLNAQQNPSRNVDKNKRPTNQPTGNPGNPSNAEAGRENPNSIDQDAANLDDQQDENEEKLLGDDNRDAKRRSDRNSNNNYRNNRVSGNPNNTDIEDGANREGSSRDGTDESAVADDADSTAMSENDQANQNTGSGVLLDESTSGSGSPAMRQEGDERDGTNNVQRAKPNMAGARVEGIRAGRRQVDSDREIRNGTQTQQRGNDVSRSRRAGQQGERMRQQNSNSQNHSDPQKETDTEQQTSTETSDDTSVANDEATVQQDQSDDKKSDKKSKRKKRRNRD
jgi:hypothetical protein